MNFINNMLQNVKKKLLRNKFFVIGHPERLVESGVITKLLSLENLLASENNGVHIFGVHFVSKSEEHDTCFKYLF